jgi:uncharacterized protein YdbL (DUF1318 family)
MKSLTLLRLIVLLALAVFGTGVGRAEDLGAVKARMEQRLGSLSSMKDRGAAGETNRGFLEARSGATAADQQLISSENADRRTVYADIAAKTGANVDAVGRARAQQIASIARKGHWLQDASGAWRQK